MHDAKKFHRITVWLATLSVASLLIFGVLVPFPDFDFWDWIKAVVAIATLVAGLWSFFTLCTMLPKRIWIGAQPNPCEPSPWRDHAFAPLVLWVLFTPMVIVLLLLYGAADGITWICRLSWIVAGTFLVAAVFLTWWLPQVFMHHAAKCDSAPRLGAFGDLYSGALGRCRVRRGLGQTLVIIGMLSSARTSDAIALPSPSSFFKSSKNSGYVLFTHSASLIVTPLLRVPATAKLIAMR